MPKCLSRWMYHLLFTPIINQSSYAPQNHQNLAMSVFEIFAIDRHIMVSYCFSLQFPNDIWHLTSFHMLISHPYIYIFYFFIFFFFAKVFTQTFLLHFFFHQVVCFLIIEFKKIFGIFLLIVLYQIYLLKIFSLSLCLHFLFSWLFYAEWKFLILIKSSSFILFLWIMLLVLYLKSSPHPK